MFLNTARQQHLVYCRYYLAFMTTLHPLNPLFINSLSCSTDGLRIPSTIYISSNGKAYLHTHHKYSR